ncbi:MAG: ParB N-terminal domain-containing protein [Clostridia bacterium]|nr:ParB N-terminal domain-containing protein [Loktanella sp.]MBQ1950288.1 ParB N-terminal domain-containing protein [Clostridia bacterium]
MSIGKNSLARAAAAAGSSATVTPDKEKVSAVTVCEVAIEAILPARGDVWPQTVCASLVESVKDHGVVEPLLLAKTEKEGPVLLGGARRLCAAKAAGLEMVPAIIREMTGAQAKSLRAELRRFAGQEEAKHVSAATATSVGQAMPDWLL